MIEVLKQARKAFEVATTPLAKDRQEVLEAIAAINQAIAELESQEPEYAWPTVADYERDVGFQTNEAFRMAWDMARTTNKMFGYPFAPQRKPLTDKAITKVIDSMPRGINGWMSDWDLYEFARAIEAAHGIGENT
jgi:hypothetical protein